MKRDAVFRLAAEQMLRGRIGPDVVVGPPLWHADGGAYFIVACGKLTGFHFDQVKAAKGVDICETRDGLLAALRARRDAVVHAMDDEMRMVEACESFWPCAGLVAIRRQVEAQRLVARHAALGSRPRLLA